MKLKIPHLILTSLPILTLNSAGALLYTVSTDASGAFTSGGWTDTVGTATVNGPAGAGNTAGVPLITGLTAGTLDLGDVVGFGTNIRTPTTATVDIALNGGTGDFFVSAISRGNARNFMLNNLSGVSSFTVEFNWSTPLAAATGGNTLGANRVPFLAAAQFTGAAAGLYDLATNYTGLQHTTDGVTMIEGLPTGAEGVDLSASGSNWNSNTSSLTWTPLGNWQGIHGFDTVGPIDGDDPTATNFTKGSNGDMILQDEEAVYGTGISFTYSTKDGSNFGTGAQFQFSTNGTHWLDSYDIPEPIPEPSSLLLLALGGASVLSRRRRVQR